MKRAYQTPTVEKVEFRYNEQVLAANSGCYTSYKNVDTDGNHICDFGDPEPVQQLN